MGTISEGRGLTLAKGVLNNFGASVGPTINDDKSDGYSPGSHWTTLSNQVFLCTDNTVGAAVWVDLTNFGALTFKGVWNAATNTPVLASGVGSEGDFYIVSVSGSTNLDGITDWLAGDMAVFANSVWSKIDNTEVIYTFQAVYDASTISPQIVLDGTNGPIEIRDNATPLVGDLTRILNNAGSVKYIGVASDGVTTDRRFIPSSNVEILAADKVLAVTAAQYQFLDAGGVDRFVDMPVGAENMLYIFKNNGSIGNLIPRDSGSIQISDPVIPGEVGGYYFTSASVWERVDNGKPSETLVKEDQFVATVAQVAFNLSFIPSSSEATWFVRNGVVMTEGIDYTLAGQIITWISTNPFAGGEDVAIKYLVSTGPLAKIKSSWEDVDYSANNGNLRVRNLGTTANFNFNVRVPDEAVNVIGHFAECLPSAGAAGAGKDIDLDSEYGLNGEVRNQNQELNSIVVDFTGLTDSYALVDVSSVFTSAQAGSRGGLNIDHMGIGGNVSYTRILTLYI